MPDSAVKHSIRRVKCPKCSDGDLFWFRDDSAPRGKKWSLRNESGTIEHKCTNGIRPLTDVLQDIRAEQAKAAQEVVEKMAVAQAPQSVDDLMGLIPDKRIADSYIPRALNGKTDLETVVNAIQNNQPVLLVGDTGTGKSHLAEAAFAVLQRPCVTISGNGGIMVEDLLGQQQFLDGRTEWFDGVGTKMFRYGGGLIVDEVNAIPTEISFAMHQMNDWRRTLVLTQKRGGEVLRAHPNFALVACMNPDYRGTKPLNEAFADRYTDGVILYLDYDPKVERRLIADHRLLEMAGKLRESYRSGELATPTSTRALLGYERNVRLHGDQIAKQSFLNRYAQDERQAVSEVMDLILGKPTA